MSNSTTKKFSPITLPPQTSKSSFWQPPINDVQPQVSRFQAEEDSAGWQAPPNMGVENNLIMPLLQGSIQAKCETCEAEEKEPQIQTKLTIGTPGDPYEQEADQVAARDMAMSDNSPQVQRFGEAKNPIQMWSEQQSITPVVQRQVDEQVQMRELVQRAFQGVGTPASGDLESRLNASKGGGSALAPEVRSFMEPRFGADFSGVRVHTGSDAVQMNREIGAQAFTHGSDVFFEEGKSPGNNELTAHELTHVMQQQVLSSTSSLQTASYPKIQRFAGSEHKKLGDVTNITIDLGNGVSLTWGQVVAIAGDEFGSLDDLMKQVQTPEGKAQIRIALENAGVPGDAVKTLPAPTEDQRSQANTRYITLAAQNVSHFAAGGTALENWRKYHAEAVDKALRAGLVEDLKQLNLAYLSEAFGQHYLTDMFSGGHIRTPRKEIIEWYTGTFAPKVIDTLINNLRTRMVDEIYKQVSAQSRTARIFESKAREKIKNSLNEQMNAAIAKVEGGKAQLIQYLGLAIAGIVSGAIHDMEGKRGVVVSSKAHPEPWKAMGDGSLDSKENETNKAQAETAVLTALQDVKTAYQIGSRENQTKKIVPSLDKLPSRILFGFNSDTLTPTGKENLTSAAAYMIHNPNTHLALVGHTDPIGKKDYNQNLGLRRAVAVSRVLSNQGVAASQFSISSAGDQQLLETNPRRYAQNRRVEFTWSIQTPTNDTVSHDIAYDRAQDAAKAQIGPPYKQVERLLPAAVSGQNPDLPDWHWGSLPPEFQQEVGNWVKGYLDKELQTKILSSKELDPKVVEGNTIEPRPIVEGLLRDLLKNPIGFLSTSFGTAAGPSK